MPKLDRYLTREFVQSTFAALIVLGMASMSGVIADLLQEIARGKVPAGLLLSQLGLRVVLYLPLILPLALMLGLLLALGRMYRDSEMPALAAAGVGPRRLLRPFLLATMPVVVAVGLCSLWLGPTAQRVSNQMIDEANRNLLVSGMEAGRFTEMGSGGVVYIGAMSTDGTRLQRMFVYREKGDRIDVTTARTGSLFFDGKRERYLRLEDGFRVEGPATGGRNYRLMRYKSNEVRMPDRATTLNPDAPEMKSTAQLLAAPGRAANAQLHRRLAPPLLALAFALLAVPLARSPPRQARYGRVMLAFLAYMVGVNLMLLGTDWLSSGRLPPAAGLWWLTLPLLGMAAWFYLRDGRSVRPWWRR